MENVESIRKNMLNCHKKYLEKLSITNYIGIKDQWRSKRGASGGTRLGAQALGAHQHTFYSH